jgi:hypothetical protein
MFVTEIESPFQERPYSMSCSVACDTLGVDTMYKFRILLLYA